SASSSLTWAGVGLPDSRSLRKGCIVIPPMLCYLRLESSKDLSSRPIDSASLGTSPRPQSLCKSSRRPVHGLNAISQGSRAQLLLTGDFAQKHWSLVQRRLNDI